MGINFSHFDTGISHRAFSEFRTRLAEAAGIPIRELTDSYDWRDGRLECTCRASRSWHEFDDPIIPFLMAGDTEASFSPTECRSIKRRLQEIASGLHGSQHEYTRSLAFDLATAMSKASFLGEEFYWIG